MNYHLKNFIKSLKPKIFLLSLTITLLAGGQFCSSAHASAGDDPPLTSQGHPQIAKFINLSEPDTLKPLLADQGAEHLSKALEIVKSTYESGVRPVGGNKYGLAFPMHPEILAHAMISSKGEVVLEIGGASGENSMLFAFAGARQVYLNEIEPSEVALFETKRAQLPSDVKSRLKSISGSVFDLLTMEPDLRGKVGLVLCRNVLHFFKDQQCPEFFRLLKDVLKPGGQVIFTVNSPHNLPELQPVFEVNPLATRFNLTRCLLTDFSRGNTPCHSFLSLYSVCPEDLDPLSFTKSRLLETTDDAWVMDMTAVDQLDKDIKQPIMDEIHRNKPMIASIQGGRITVLTNIIRLYTRATLSRLFESHGFQVNSTFLIGINGHTLADDAALLTQAQQVGLIARFTR